MAKKDQVKFRLFEKNGTIRIAIQTIPTQENNNSKLNTSAEYYIASDPRNISRILDTLVSTVKDVSISGDSLHTNYRKNDTFIIEDYERLQNHPELKPFFDKMGGKIKQQEKKKNSKKKVSSKRRNIHIGKKVLAAASFLTVLIISGFCKSDMIAQGAVSDTLVMDNTDDNSETTEDEIQEVLEKYQASIIENQSNVYETVESEIMTQTDVYVEDVTIEETAEEIPIGAGTEETVEIVSGDDSQNPETSIDTTFEDQEEVEEFQKGEEQQEQSKESTQKEEQQEQEKEEEKLTDEVILAKVDEEIEQIAADLVAQSKTSDEDVRKAAETALQDGQAQGEVVQVEQTQVVTASITDTATPAMNANGTGINYVETYHLTPEQIDIIKATIQHEAGFNPVEVEKVTSTVINRCESGGWPGGTNPYGVILGKGQFQSYYDGHYKKYLNGNYEDYTDQIVDAMLLGEQLPSHDFERFSSGPGATGTQFTKNGNFFR